MEQLIKFLIAALFVITSACTKAPSHKISDINNVFENYWEEKSKLYPLDATSQGDNRYNDLLPNDQTKEFRQELIKFHQRYLTQLKTFKRESLNENDKVSYDIFKYEMEVQLESFNNDQWMIPFTQFWGLPITMGQLGSGESFQPFKTVEDYRNWLKRISGFVQWSNSAIENFKVGMKHGIVLPKKLVIKIIPQMDAMIVTDPTKSLFYGPINKFPESFSAKEKEELTEAYKKAILTEIVPTYKKLGQFFKKEYLPKARNTHGISSLKNGTKLYKFLVNYWTTTQKSPNEIYQAGLGEVKRIRAEMERVKKEVGFKGTLAQFFQYLKTDKKFYPYKTPAEVIAAFHKVHETIKPKLKLIFSREPKTPFEIRQTEEFRAATASAEYNPGSPDGSRPGIFYVPIVDATNFNMTSGMESLFLHEAIPGHHYQISLQQEYEGLPKFRRFSWYGSYGEGWALYTESLGKELGLYTDPYQYMGALGDEMHRAVRLVVDVAIHLKGMSREQAIKYMLSNQPISEEGATSEIERYMALPAQALSYKIGSMKIWELRNKYKQKMGEKFNLAHFHDEFLKDGCMPLAVIESKMNAWAN